MSAPQHDPPDETPLRLTYRTMRTIEVIGGQPGLSNSQLSERVGIVDQGQISKLLARLARRGLIENTGDGHGGPGAGNAWQLTAEGELFKRRIDASLSFDGAQGD